MVIDPANIPRHVALIMDGNGRWATRRGLPRTEGHAAGEDALFDVAEGALEMGVEWVTVYAFSTENWKRPADEVKYLMEFNEGILLRHRDDLHSRNVRMRFIGRRNWRVPRRILRRMDESVELTRDNTKMTFTVAFNYGSKPELVDAVRAIVAEGVKPRDVDEDLITSHLYDPEMPEVDLLIRTSGEHRISNFMLWQAAYSELVFTDVLWPDFRREHLHQAVEEYQRRNRRFGALDDEPSAPS